MFQTILNYLYIAIRAVYDWFFSIYDAIPTALSFVFGMFVVYLSYKFLLQPLFHGGFSHVGSDKSRKENKSKE